MSSSLEREVKLDLGAGFTMPDVAALGFRVRQASEQVLTAVYYDTPDYRLSRRRASLRYRDDGWTVKLPGIARGPLLQRREITWDAPPEAVPTAALDLVRHVIRSADLEPVATVRTARTTQTIEDGTGAVVAEVAVDSVIAARPTGETVTWNEAEIELLGSAGDGVLDGLVGLLRRHGAGPSVALPKIVRALDLNDATNLSVVASPVDANEVVVAAFAASVGRYVDHAPGVVLGEDREAVHQARVATRRLRSDLRSFRALLDWKWARGLRRDLKGLAAELGFIRDLDVLEMRLETDRTVLAGVSPGAVTDLLDILDRDRQAHRARLIEVFRSRGYADLLDELHRAATDPPLVDPAGAVDLVKVVARPWLDLSAYVAKLGSEPTNEELHRARILAKRARYAAEAVAPAVGSRASLIAESASAIQDLLGEQHDALVAAHWLEAVSLDQPGLAPDCTIMAERERAESRRLADLWPEAWGRASRPSVAGWLT